METSSNDNSSLTDGPDESQVITYLANFIESSLDPIVGYNSHGLIVFWNLAAERTFGWTSSEALGKSSADLFWPAYTIQEQEDQRQRKLSLDGGEVVQGEQIMQRKEGSLLWVKYSIHAIIEIGSRVSGYVALYRDITERKQAEQQLERNNQWLNEILGSIQDDFYVLDRNWKFVYASRQFTARIGKEPKDFVGNNIWEMFPKHVGSVLEENFRAAMDRREVRRFEIPGKYPDAWYRMTAFPSEEGITVLGTDITELKRTEGQLRYHAALLSNVNDAIIASDAEFHITAWNPAAESLYGWKAKEVTGRYGLEIIRTEWPGRDADEMRRTIVETGRWRGEATQVRKDGSRFPVEISSMVLYDADKQITGYVSVNRDITERKFMEREIASLARFPRENPNPVMRIQQDGVIAFANASSDNLLRLWDCAVGERLPGCVHRLILQSLESRLAIEEEVDCAGQIYSLIFTPLAESGYVNIYGRDITERKRAEQALRQAQLDLERAQEVGQIGSWRLDVRQDVLAWSDEIYRLFGVPIAAPMTYEAFLSLVHPDDQQEVDAQWRAGMEGKPYDIEHRIVVDERVKWVREKAYLEFDDAGSLLGGFGITQDITERKQAEQDLRSSEERFRNLASAVPSMVWTAAPDGTILYSNEQWHNYTGLSPEDNATNWAELVLHPDDYERCVREWTHALETVPDEYLIDVRNRRYDGQYRWFQTRAIPARNDDGEVIAWYGVTTDIHDRVEAIHAMRDSQQQLQFLNESLEQKVDQQTAELRRLTANLTKAEQRERNRIAHILHDDLQQRIYAVKMRLTLLGNDLNVDSAVEREVVELDKQLADILLLTRQLTIELSPPVLRDEGLRQAIEWLAVQMDEKLGLRIEVRAEESFAMADEAVQVLLFNCVRELLFNIVKHAGVHRAVVSLQRVGDLLQIEVQDEGNGFDLAALFGDNKNNVGNTEEMKASFGLSTLRHQLGLLGGQLAIQSEPGAGTRITIKIPF